MARSVLGYRSMSDAHRALYAKGESVQAIADMTGDSTPNIRKVLGLIHYRDDGIWDLDEEARRSHFRNKAALGARRTREFLKNSERPLGNFTAQGADS